MRPPQDGQHLVRGEGVKIDTSHKEGNNLKHTAVTDSCEHRPFSHNLGLTYLRGLLSPEDQSLRSPERVSPVPLCPWAVDLTPLVLSIKCYKVTRQ